MKHFLAVVALIVPYCAHAWTFESGAGVTSFETEDGRWYQQLQPHSLATVSPEYSIGVVGNVLSRGAWGVDWHIGYVNLGRVTSSCQCDTSDENYAAHNTQHTALFSGSGRAQGVALTFEPYRWYGGARVGIEAGVFAYRSTWNETVTGWSVGGPPQDLSLSANRWNVAPVVGMSVGGAVWSVSYRHYFMRVNSARQNVPPLWNDADVIEIKRRF